MHIVPLTTADNPDWLRLRQALWPETSPEEHREDMVQFLSEPHRFIQFICNSDQGGGFGFVEASIRNDYVNGTDSSPVAFLEGIYVIPQARRQGIARALVAEVEKWSKAAGCKELASDAPTRNRKSHAVHKKLGFGETERVVYFAKHIK